MRVALLMNFIAPYRVPLLEALHRQVGELRAFLSTRMESDRPWNANWGTLDVVVQRTLTLRGRYHDPFGFSRVLHIHIPYDTLPQLRRHAPDVVISAELGMRSLQAALYRTLRPSTRLLIWAMLSEHSERDWGTMRTALRRRILRRADGVLVNGESGARYIGRFGVPQDRIFRINQPVDAGQFAAAARRRPADSLVRLLYVGTLSERKGLVGFACHLADWARRHPARELEICWVGDGDQRAALAAIALPPNLSQQFRGNLPYAELPGCYADADMLVFPSLLDEWGLVVNEAMAAGLPVLGSIYSQAVEELVAEGHTGWVFDPLDEHATLAALDRAFATPPTALVAMRQAARQRSLALTPTAASERIMAAIRQIVAQPRSSVTDAAAPAAARPG
jgi:glycosyltransferase involved in cell wall biosynthesis